MRILFRTMVSRRACRHLCLSFLFVLITSLSITDAGAKKGGNSGGGSQEQASLKLCVTSVTGDIQDDGSEYCDSKKDKVTAVIGDKKFGFNINTSNGDNGRSMTITLDGLGSQTFSHFILNIFNEDGSDFKYSDFQAIQTGTSAEVIVLVRFPADGFSNAWWWLEYGVPGELYKPVLTRNSVNSFSLHVGVDVVGYLSTDQGATDLGQGSVPFDLEAEETP